MSSQALGGGAAHSSLGKDSRWAPSSPSPAQGPLASRAGLGSAGGARPQCWPQRPCREHGVVWVCLPFPKLAFCVRKFIFQLKDLNCRSCPRLRVVFPHGRWSWRGRGGGWWPGGHAVARTQPLAPRPLGRPLFECRCPRSTVTMKPTCQTPSGPSGRLECLGGSSGDGDSGSCVGNVPPVCTAGPPHRYHLPGTWHWRARH